MLVAFFGEFLFLLVFVIDQVIDNQQFTTMHFFCSQKFHSISFHLIFFFLYIFNIQVSFASQFSLAKQWLQFYNLVMCINGKSENVSKIHCLNLYVFMRNQFCYGVKLQICYLRGFLCIYSFSYYSLFLFRKKNQFYQNEDEFIWRVIKEKNNIITAVD